MQCALQRSGIGEFAARDRAAQVFEDRGRRLDADVRRQQPRFEILEERIVDPAAGQQVRDPGGAAIDPRAQAREKSAGFSRGLVVARDRRPLRAGGWLNS